MARLDELKAKLSALWEKIRESELYQDLKSKYDELDSQKKLWINLGAAGACVLLVLSTIFGGMAKVNSLQNEIDEHEELIGYLQRSGDSLKQLKAQQTTSRGSVDVTSPLPAFVETIVTSSGLDKGKVEIGPEKAGKEEKDVREALVEVKLTQVNLRQVTRLLFNLTDQGAPRNLNIKDLSIDTKGDAAGYLEALITVAAYKGK